MPLASHHRLPDVHHLGGVAAEDVHAEQLQVIGGDQQLEHAVGVAGDLPAGQFAVPGDPHLVRNRSFGQFNLGGADIGHLGDRINADRLQLGHPVHRLAECVVGGQPTLFHRRRGERGKADDVADGVDVVDLGLEPFVDEDPAAVVGLQARVARSRWSVWPCRPAEYITVSAGICLPLASLVMVPPAPTSTAVTSSPNRNVTARSRRWNRNASMISGIAEFQHGVALFDDGDLGAQRGEHRCVLDADHAGADHDHGRRDRLEIKDAVGVQHSLLVELDTFGAGRLGPGGDDDVLAADRGALAARTVLDEQGVFVDGTGPAPAIRSTRLRISWLRTMSACLPMTCWFATAGQPV